MVNMINYFTFSSYAYGLQVDHLDKSNNINQVHLSSPTRAISARNFFLLIYDSKSVDVQSPHCYDIYFYALNLPCEPTNKQIPIPVDFFLKSFP